MPYITQNLRDLIEANDIIQKIGRAIENLDHAHDKCTMTFFAVQNILESRYLDQATTKVPEWFDPVADLVEELNDNLVNAFQSNNHNGMEGLLNYTLTRLFNEIFKNARYQDYNDIIGILTYFSHEFKSYQVKGMLTCCAMEYYRKYVAPYEELKESENGSVIRPTQKPSGY